MSTKRLPCPGLPSTAKPASHFDQVIAEILSDDFSVTRPPEKRVCKECDLRRYCRLQPSNRGIS